MLKKIGQTILWLRAKDYLQRYHLPLIGVAGSTDRGVATAAIAAVFSTTYRVRHSPLGANTRAGIASSILGIAATRARQPWYQSLPRSKAKELTDYEPDVIVLELGASRPGDIDYAATHLPFQGAVVTNVHSSHLDLFGSQELVAHELASLVVSTTRSGFVVLNVDDPLVRDMQTKSQARVITYGTSADATVRLLHTRSRGRIGVACAVNIAGHIYELHFPNIVSEYQIPSLISSLAVAYAMGINLSKAINAIQPLQPTPGHMRFLAGHNHAVLLDDSYDASPESTHTALQTLRSYPATRKIAILGDVLDLGTQTITSHQQIGHTVAGVANIFVAVGSHMRHAGAAALRHGSGNQGQNSLDIHYFSSSRDVGKWLRDFLHPDDVVLIKGSRAMRMEEVTRRLLSKPADESQLVP